MDSRWNYQEIAKNHEFALRGEFLTFGQPEGQRQRRVLRTNTLTEESDTNMNSSQYRKKLAKNHEFVLRGEFLTRSRR